MLSIPVIFVFELKFMHNELMWPTRISSFSFFFFLLLRIILHSSKSSIDFVLNENEKIDIFYSIKGLIYFDTLNEKMLHGKLHVTINIHTVTRVLSHEY